MHIASRSLARLAGYSVSADGSLVFASPPYASMVTAPGNGSPMSFVSASSSVDLDRHALTASYRSAYAPAADAVHGRYKIFRRYRVLVEVPMANGGTQWWFSPNSYTKDMPPPPEPTNGPYGCDCKDIDTGAVSRYGSSQCTMWMWCPDFFASTYQYRAFISDLFQGEGPCLKPNHPGVLSQWDDLWVVKRGDKFLLKDYERGFFEFIEGVSVRALARLGVPAPVNVPQLPNEAESLTQLKENWAAWVAHRQVCSGLIFERLVGHDLWDEFREQNGALWKDMELAMLFDHAAVGAWFRDTEARLSVIRELISKGVPVFYRWTGSLDDVPEAAFLRPGLSLPPLDAAPPGALVIAMQKPESVPQPVELPMSPRRQRWIGPSTAVVKKDATRDIGRAKKRDDEGSSSSADDNGEDLIWATHAEGFEQGYERGVRTLADRLGVAPHELLYPPPTEAAVEYILVKDFNLTGRIDATRGAGARKEKIAKLTALIFKEVVASPQPESYTATLTVIEPKDDPDVSTLETRISSPGRERPYSIMLYDIGDVDKEVRALIAIGKLDSDKVLLEFFLKHHIHFTTGVPRTMLAKRDHTAEVAVHSSWWTTDDQLPAMFAKWRANAAVLLRQRPRAFRAAFARGGLVARLARFLLGPGIFPLMPSSVTRANGCPLPLAANGLLYHYDWLDEDELHALLGYTAPTASTPRSLWPPAEIFDARYAGVWVSEYEGWFSARVEELRTGSRGPGKTAKGLLEPQEWNTLLQNSALG